MTVLLDIIDGLLHVRDTHIEDARVHKAHIAKYSTPNGLPLVFSYLT